MAEGQAVPTSALTTTPTSGPPNGTGRFALRALPWVVVVAASGYTAVILAYPSARTSWYSPDARVLIEALSLAVALFAALALSSTREDSPHPSRNAFTAALLALAVSYGIVVTAFLVLVSPSENEHIVGAYAWLMARYLAGVFFILGAIGRPRLSLRQFALVLLAVLAVTIAACAVLADRLPTPVAETVQGLALVTTAPVEKVVMSLVPGALFGVGAVLAWRVQRWRHEQFYGWLAFALALQTLSKIHESVYPETFGPQITSSDLLRAAMLVLLLTGAVLTVRDLAADRAAAVEAQQRDLDALETMYGALARFAEKEQVFRSVVVHELATPVAAARAFAHVLSNASAGADRHAATAGLAAALRRLQELIDRIEELRGIENEGFSVELRPVALRPLIEDTAAFLRVLPSAHQVVVDADDLKVMADPLRLGQALRNVATNAARYSPDGSLIVLSARRVGDRSVEIAVVDSGPGIPRHDRDRLLLKYQRGTEAADTPGAGLGLYIAERIIAAHGGRLSVSDPPDGAGTKVVLELRRDL